MSAHWKILQALLVAALWVGVAGSGAQGQLMPPKENGKGAALDAWSAPATTGMTSTTGTTGTSKSADRPSKKIPSEKKEKRANTPPGTDRAGDAPAAGAIVDPSGVTTKK